eukprot:scaffold5_cov169-Amphora_coffeaeformis.AAC.29
MQTDQWSKLKGMDCGHPADPSWVTTRKQGPGGSELGNASTNSLSFDYSFCISALAEASFPLLHISCWSRRLRCQTGCADYNYE